MRIAYVTLHWPRRRASGIGRKIEEQMAAWRQEGHTVQLFSHRTPVDHPDELVDGLSFEYKPTGKLMTEINRSRAIPAMVEAVKKFSPDVIYLRWSMYVFPSHRLFHVAPVVVEINTDDISQHQMLGKIYSTYNRLTRGIYLKHAAGLVFTSGELQTCNSFVPFKRPNVVIANGIDLSQNPESPAPDNARPRIGFIGTPDLSWQGVDKIVRLAELCPDLDIDVIGFDGLEDGSRKPDNLYFHGYLEKDQARAILAKDDVGLGTLALHRKGMDEASSLKTREYLAYGIPVIIPYIDTDLSDLNADTILYIPNTEDTVDQNWQAIHDFAFRMRGKRIDREMIYRRIDSHIKEKVRLQFFEECLNGSKTCNE
jgi:hypothetical protein